MNNQHSDFITNTRTATTKLIEAIDELRALDKQRQALDLVNQLTTDDFAGANAGLDVAAISGITTTLGALEGLLAQGHSTNLYKVKL